MGIVRSGIYGIAGFAGLGSDPPPHAQHHLRNPDNPQIRQILLLTTPGGIAALRSQ